MKLAAPVSASPSVCAYQQLQPSRTFEDFRFAEVESLEEELEKVRRQLQRVVARDYFESPAKEEAQAGVLAAEAAFETYVELASEQSDQ